ncbi:hypothetical protein, partial [Tannerella forsythia]|uniref:hypothetical protein n=1 Tax=Tannerella forsythia TaxID=28112 RepID=UPI0021AB1BD6
EETLSEITDEVNRQQQAFYRIFNEGILPELRRQKICLYQGEEPEPFHRESAIILTRKYFPVSFSRDDSCRFSPKLSLIAFVAHLNPLSTFNQKYRLSIRC